MKKWIAIDDKSRIIGINANDMTGNTGWQAIDEPHLTELTGATYDTLFNGLYNGQGIPLYKLVGEYVEPRTAEEIAVDVEELPPPGPTADELLNYYNATKEALNG